MPNPSDNTYTAHVEREFPDQWNGEHGCMPEPAVTVTADGEVTIRENLTRCQLREVLAQVALEVRTYRQAYNDLRNLRHPPLVAPEAVNPSGPPPIDWNQRAYLISNNIATTFQGTPLLINPTLT